MTSDYEQFKLQAILKLRWIAIFCQIAILAPGIKLGYIEKENTLYFLCVTLFLFILNSKCIWKGFKFYQEITIHLVIDVITFTALILISGKMENPFWPLIYIHAGIAAILLKPKHDRFFLPILVFCMIIVHFSSYSFHSAILYTIFPQWVILISAWTLTRVIGLSILQQRENLSLLQEKNSKIQNLKSLSSLSAGILHELGTPLNTIRLKVDKIIKNNSSHDKDIAILETALIQCEETISKLNEAQQEASENSVKLINIRALVLELKQRWDVQYPQLQFEMNMPEDIECNLSKVSLSLIFKVFIDNALESHASKFYFNLKESEGRALLEIEDNGPGFSNFILENFGAPYTSTKGRGRGLGLFSSLVSIEAMGGQMSLSNTEQGAKIALCFTKVVI